MGALFLCMICREAFGARQLAAAFGRVKPFEKRRQADALQALRAVRLQVCFLFTKTDNSS